MTHIQFLGAAGMVTGSCYLLTTDKGDRILIDFGQFQGTEEIDNLNYVPLTFDPTSLTAVILTHAHLDHCGRLPILAKKGFKGTVYATKATQKITEISLLDAAAIAKEDENGQILFSREDAMEIFKHFENVDYDIPFNIGSFTITFRNAGHILGSCSLEIREGDQTIAFSGDLGNSPEDLIQPTEYINKAQTIIIESTYGASLHTPENVRDIIQKQINTIEENHGVLLIPAFSIERTQEILHLIGHLRRNNLFRQNTPVFLDSPMAIEVTEIFKEFPVYYNSELKNDPQPFDFSNLTLTLTVPDSKNIYSVPGPKVIIAGSGMMSGGRIMHHLANYINLSTTEILIVGYQAQGTLGRVIESGAKSVTLYKHTLPVMAKVTKLDSLSSHADQAGLMSWLKHITDIKQIFLVHGEDKQRAVLAEKIKTDVGIQNIILPLMNQGFDVGTGDGVGSA